MFRIICTGLQDFLYGFIYLYLSKMDSPWGKDVNWQRIRIGTRRNIGNHLLSHEGIWISIGWRKMDMKLNRNYWTRNKNSDKKEISTFLRMKYQTIEIQKREFMKLQAIILRNRFYQRRYKKFHSQGWFVSWLTPTL